MRSGFDRYRLKLDRIRFGIDRLRPGLDGPRPTERRGSSFLAVRAVFASCRFPDGLLAVVNIEHPGPRAAPHAPEQEPGDDCDESGDRRSAPPQQQHAADGEHRTEDEADPEEGAPEVAGEVLERLDAGAFALSLPPRPSGSRAQIEAVQHLVRLR